MEEYSGDGVVMVDFVDERNGTTAAGVRKTAVETLRMVIGSIEGLKMPVVNAVTVVED